MSKYGLLKPILEADMDRDTQDILNELKAKGHNFKPADVYNVRSKLRMKPKNRRSLHVRNTDNAQPLWTFIVESLSVNNPFSVKEIVESTKKLGYKTQSNSFALTIRKTLKRLLAKKMVRRDGNQWYLTKPFATKLAKKTPVKIVGRIPANNNGELLQKDLLLETKQLIEKAGGFEKFNNYLEVLATVAK